MLTPHPTKYIDSKESLVAPEELQEKWNKSILQLASRSTRCCIWSLEVFGERLYESPSKGYNLPSRQYFMDMICVLKELCN